MKLVLLSAATVSLGSLVHSGLAPVGTPASACATASAEIPTISPYHVALHSSAIMGFSAPAGKSVYHGINDAPAQLIALPSASEPTLQILDVRHRDATPGRKPLFGDRRRYVTAMDASPPSKCAK